MAALDTAAVLAALGRFDRFALTIRAILWVLKSIQQRKSRAAGLDWWSEF